MRPLRPTVRCLAAVVFIASYAVTADTQSSCGKTDSIAVSIRTTLDEHQMPLINLSVRNISGRTLTCKTLDSTNSELFPRIHLEGVHSTPSKSIWYRQLNHEFGYPELPITLNVDCASRFGKSHYAPGETISFKYPLMAYYFVDKPGDYSVYLEVHDPEETCDPAAKWQRTNTAQFEITPEQVKVWEAHAGAPRVRATINMQQPVISLQRVPTIQIELQNDDYTSYDGDDFFPHVERDSVDVAKTTYYRERLHESGTRQYGFMEGPEPDYPERSRRSHSIQAHQSSAWEIVLGNFYRFDMPGKYSVYVEFPDFSGKLLRSNTLEFEVKAPN